MPAGTRAKRWLERRPGIDAKAPLLHRILAARGITADSADSFLTPSLKHLHDPELMPGVDRAAERLLAAARAGERTVIYGDYDVDGVSATAILYHTLKAVAPGADVATYVPDRLEEGYGLNPQSIAKLCKGDSSQPPARVIVSVDCGITAVEPARVARELGVDLIITDHHNPPAPGEQLPDAYALVHPRLPGSQYPFADLCGAAVAHKLAWRIMTLAHGSARLSDPLRALLLELLGVCALGVVADVVPLVGENRAIAHFGLRSIKHSSIEGLRALVHASGLSGERIKAEDVGFKLGPRLNACGRMGHAREAVELLTTATGQRAIEIAETLTRQNDERRRIERATFDEACALADSAGMTGEATRAIVLSNPGWHPGVVGIVCSRLVERFHRPAILLCECEDANSSGGGSICRGSGRSVDGVNLHGALAACAAHLQTFGGHDMAAGLKLSRHQLEAFVSAFTDHIGGVLRAEDMVGRASFDTHASIAELTVDAASRLEALAPFGRDNPTVVVRLDGLTVAQRPTLMGGDGAHLAMHLRSPEGFAMRAIAWRWGARVREFQQGAGVDVLATPKINTWNDRRTTELELVDIRPARS